MKLYEALAQEIEDMVARQVLLPGERLPSVRQQYARRGASPGTVFQAYYLLEARGVIESRPRSGYYVSPARAPDPVPGAQPGPQPNPHPHPRPQPDPEASRPDGAPPPAPRTPVR